MKLLAILLLGIAAYLLLTRPAAPAGGLSGAFAAAPGHTGGLTSSPIGTDSGAFGFNVRCALDARGGALRSFTVAPGSTWSFNAAMGDPSGICQQAINGTPGAGWCNLAARYAQAARAAGLAPIFADHGVGDMGAGPENSVLIWNVDGQPGNDGDRRDLLLRNDTSRAVRFMAVAVGGDAVAIEATAE